MWWLSGLAAAHIPVFISTGPSEDWCGAYNSALQGDIVLLAPGDYTGPCTLLPKALDPAYPTEVTLFTAEVPEDRPRFHSDGVAPFILSLAGDQVQISGLAFPDVPAGTTAIEIADGQSQWIYDTAFTGAAIATRGTVTSLRLEQLTATGTGGTAFAIGCAGCATTGLVVEQILASGFDTALKVDATGAIGEVVSDGGIGLDLTGALAVNQSAIRGDIVIRGPATLQSNIVLGTVTVEAAGAKLYGNTIYDPAALVLSSWGEGSVLQDNAISGTVPDVTGATGNIACTEAADCWRDPDGLDFYPRAGGPLKGGGVPADAGFLFTDWCGFARVDPLTVGALEWLGSPIAPLRFDAGKTFESCLPVGEIDSASPVEEDTGSPPLKYSDNKGGGCCATSPTPPATWLAFLAPLALGWRVRRR